MGGVMITDWTPTPPPATFTLSIHSPKNKSRSTTVVVETGVEEAPLSRSTISSSAAELASLSEND